MWHIMLDDIAHIDKVEYTSLPPARTGNPRAPGAGNPLIPARGDIVDRNGVPLARTIDAWSIGIHPRRVIGDRLS